MKRALPIIAFVVLTLLAVGAGYGVNRGLLGVVAMPEGASVTSVASDGAPRTAEATTDRRPRPVRRSKSDYLKPIIDRYLFDSTKAGLGAVVDGDGDEAITDLNIRLLGTLVAVPEEYSSALIVETEGDKPAVGYGMGDSVMDAEIIKIEETQVTLRRSTGAIEVLTLNKEGAPTRTAAASTGAAGDDDEHVEQISETKFAVDRELIDKYLSDVDGLARLGRAIPHRGPDGDIDGYRLSGIRRRSVGEKLGIKNGDVVHAVNGQQLTSMQGALSAFTSLQSDSSFNFEVTRRGQKVTLEYEIR